MSTTSAAVLSKRVLPRRAVAKKLAARAKKPFKLELTADDIALDNAISIAAARSLASRQP